MAITNFAEEIYRSQNDGVLVPRQRFNFTMTVNTPAGLNHFHQVASLSAPGFSVDGELMNQYNKKRFVQTRLNYDPITVVFYDTFNNEWHNLMREYMSFYYNTGNGIEKRTTLEGISTVASSFTTDLGFTPNQQRYFFPEIKIVQNGYRNKYRETTLINPHITDIRNSDLNYSDSQPVEYTVTFQPESVQVEHIDSQFDDGI